LVTGATRVAGVAPVSEKAFDARITWPHDDGTEVDVVDADVTVDEDVDVPATVVVEPEAVEVGTCPEKLTSRPCATCASVTVSVPAVSDVCAITAGMAPATEHDTKAPTRPTITKAEPRTRRRPDRLPVSGFLKSLPRSS
jgi:hypothetical protein